MPDRAVPDLGATYEDRRPQLESLAFDLRRIVTDELTGPHVDRVSFRVKAADEFVRKASATRGDGEPKYRDPLREIEDQIAGRVLVFFRGDLEPVTARCGPRWAASSRNAGARSALSSLGTRATI